MVSICWAKIEGAIYENLAFGDVRRRVWRWVARVDGAKRRLFQVGANCERRFCCGRLGNFRRFVDQGVEPDKFLGAPFKTKNLRFPKGTEVSKNSGRGI